MKKCFKKISLFLISAGLVISPFVIFTLVENNYSEIYSKTYYAALIDKHDYLESIKDEKKIILIGGSNVAFGFDSEYLEKEFEGYKVVNFGLYAALGTKIMIDLAKPYIGQNDIAIIIPEISTQSMSLYFSGKDTWKAIETRKSLISKFDANDKKQLAYDYFQFATEKMKYHEAIEPNGIYRRDSFNKYGDISYKAKQNDETISKRKSNILPLHYDPSMPVSFNLDINEDFINYINTFSNDVTNKGAFCYYSWCPVNEFSIEDKNKDSIADLYWNIRNKLACKVIGNPEEYVFNSHYFYDSNFHLNDSGALMRTMRFIENYKRDIELRYCSYADDYPIYPDYETKDIDTSIDSDTAKCFIYEEHEGLLEIVGTNTNENNFEDITIPIVANHKRVAGIGSNAFSNSLFSTIHIPSSIVYIQDEAFANSNIKSIYMQSKKPEETNISWDGGLIRGANPEIAIYVPKESLSDYKNDYYWGPYSRYLKGYDFYE